MESVVGWLLLAVIGYLAYRYLSATNKRSTGSTQRRSSHSRRHTRLPKSRKVHRTGFWWHRPPLVALAAGQGWNTQVAGESYRQEALADIVGGYGLYGCMVHATAQLALPLDMPDHPDAVAVLIDGKHVGFIPADLSAQIKAELEALPGAEGGVTCKAVIVGGWDRRGEGGDLGHFGVKLSLSRPLKIRSK